MRILFVINALSRGGAERVFVDDMNALKELGHDVRLSLLYKGRAGHELLRELNSSIAVEFLEATGPFDLGSIRRLRRLIAGERIEAVFSTLNDGNIMARFAVIGMGARLYMREANDPQRKTWWQRVLDILLSFIPNAVVVVTEDTRKKVLRQMPWMSRKSVVIHNAAPHISNAPRSWEAPFTFLFVGRFDTQKNPLALIRSFARARATVPSTLKMIGDGSLLEPSRALAQELGVSDSVTFLGARPHAEVLEHMEQAHTLVLSSLWEGCPNVVLEAMSQGLPTIATRVGGVPELIDDTCGVVVAPRDDVEFSAAMASLASNPLHAKELGDTARARAADTFSRAAHVKKVLAVLSST